MTGQNDDATRLGGETRSRPHFKREENLSLSEELFKEQRNSGATPLPTEKRESLDFATLQQMQLEELLAMRRSNRFATQSNLTDKNLFFKF